MKRRTSPDTHITQYSVQFNNWIPLRSHPSNTANSPESRQLLSLLKGMPNIPVPRPSCILYLEEQRPDFAFPANGQQWYWVCRFCGGGALCSYAKEGFSGMGGWYCWMRAVGVGGFAAATVLKVEQIVREGRNLRSCSSSTLLSSSGTRTLGRTRLRKDDLCTFLGYTGEVQSREIAKEVGGG
ncbi:uncharacterized protein EI97DRAFT_273425 [Westerdykella ornata]|uniref:Uncharacterized protein n=1 Tax=Westerdykella ornata TaxID=318751 RepID=A0A6A6JQ25_WESOR|nr:uncharacterized protein EI97DRAFT_273425 [Westerdykella ornata]KAF2277786.1 hypothetical protein EI97DRAFT_273425 [Westerdykella ornata]